MARIITNAGATANTNTAANTDAAITYALKNATYDKTITGLTERIADAHEIILKKAIAMGLEVLVGEGDTKPTAASTLTQTHKIMDTASAINSIAIKEGAQSISLNISTDTDGNFICSSAGLPNGYYKGASITYTVSESADSSKAVFNVYDDPNTAVTLNALTGTISIPANYDFQTARKYSITSKGAFSIDDTTTAVSVGTYDDTNKYYPLTASLTGKVASAGWTGTTVGTDSSVKVGTIALATCSVTGGGLSGGGLTAGSGEVSTVTQGVVTPSIGGTIVANVTSTAANSYGVTLTKPSGTDGTNFVTLDPGGSVTTNNVVKGRGSVSRAAVTRAAIKDAHTAGYLPAKDATTVISADSTTIAATSGTSNWSSNTNSNPTIAAGTNYYIPVSTASATGGTASASASIAKNPSASASAAQTGMTDGVSTTATDYYFTSSASAASGYSTASASATGGSASVSAGITAGASKSGAASGNKSATSTEKTASDSSKVYLKLATCTVTGGELTQSGNSGGGLSLGTATAPTLDIEKIAEDSLDKTVDLTVVDVGDKNTSDYPYYFKIKATSTGGGNTVTRAAFSNTVTRADITDAHTAGYLPAKTAATAIASGTSKVSLASASTTATAADGSTTEYVKLKAATVSASYSGSKTVTPVVSKTSTPSGVTNAASGNATSTAPTSGVYVAVGTAAKTTTLTPTWSVSAAGYAPTGSGNGTGQSVGANASGTYYVPITGVALNTTAGTTFGKVKTAGWIDTSYYATKTVYNSGATTTITPGNSATTISAGTYIAQNVTISAVNAVDAGITATKLGDLTANTDFTTSNDSADTSGTYMNKFTVEVQGIINALAAI